MQDKVISLRAEPEATFDEFWKHYPRKVGKREARVKWDAITSEAGHDATTTDHDAGERISLGNLKATPEELIAGAKRYRRTQIDPETYRLRHNGKYTMHAATWLNKGRWEDD